MTAVEIVNLISSLASLILALIAIWLALHFYDRAKSAEKQTAVNVNEIKTQTRALTDISSRMLDKYTDYAVQPKAADETFLAVVQLLGQTTASNITNYPTANNATELREYGISATITALFYAGITNLALQDLLPINRGLVEEDNNLPQLLDGSRDDFFVLDNTLGGVEINALNGNNLANLYQIAMGWKGNSLIRNMDELYPVPTA